MAGFLSGASDAIDALARNVLPFYTVAVDAKTQRVETQAAATVGAANAQASMFGDISRAKIAWGVGIASAALVLFVVIKKRRG